MKLLDGVLAVTEMLFGDLIKEYRQKQNLSIRELARRIDVDISYISRMEKNAHSSPSFTILVRLAKELELDFEELLRLFDTGVTTRDLNLGHLDAKNELPVADAKLVERFHHMANSMVKSGNTEVLGQLLNSVMAWKSEKTGETTTALGIARVEEGFSLFKMPAFDTKLLHIFGEVYSVNTNDILVLEGNFDFPLKKHRFEISIIDVPTLYRELTKDAVGSYWITKPDWVEYVEEVMKQYELDLK